MRPPRCLLLLLRTCPARICPVRTHAAPAGYREQTSMRPPRCFLPVPLPLHVLPLAFRLRACRQPMHRRLPLRVSQRRQRHRSRRQQTMQNRAHLSWQVTWLGRIRFFARSCSMFDVVLCLIRLPYRGVHPLQRSRRVEACRGSVVCKGPCFLRMIWTALVPVLVADGTICPLLLSHLRCLLRRHSITITWLQVARRVRCHPRLVRSVRRFLAVRRHLSTMSRLSILSMRLTSRPCPYSMHRRPVPLRCGIADVATSTRLA